MWINSATFPKVNTVLRGSVFFLAVTTSKKIPTYSPKRLVWFQNKVTREPISQLEER